MPTTLGDTQNNQKSLTMAGSQDQRGRPLRDLRISVIDRCNLRCQYCMPEQIYGPDFRFLPHSKRLSYDELSHIASCFIDMGVTKIRLSGGEPLLRPHLDQLIRQLRSLSAELHIALTTNGLALSKHAQKLASAGLNQVNVSLDGLDSSVLHKMSGKAIDNSKVLEGIYAARTAGLKLKVNMVVKKGVNETEILPLAKLMHKERITLRFIEYMDVGESNQWNRQEVVSGPEILNLLKQHHDLQSVDAMHGETAKRYRYSDGVEVGFINSITQAFCSECTRARISADGKLYTCLFSEHGYNIKTWLREEKIDTPELLARFKKVWHQRDDNYSETRTNKRLQKTHHTEMWTMGG